jgi:YVTN family beta-propeller protein
VIDYRLLGPLEVAVNGHAVDVGGLKQRALLAILLLHANQPVNRDVLIDQLWAEHPPARAEHAVEVYIWRLRKALEPAAGRQGVLTRPGAYLLQAAAEQVDVARFEHLAEAGRRALAAEDPGRAAADLGEALALCRGPLLADFRSEPFAQAEIARLEELRAGVVEDRIEADLALGRHASVVSELEALVAMWPLRERLHQQLMVALYRCGRQADALAVYQKARRTLVADLGIEPGEPLRRLERAILGQDPSLEPAPSTRPSQALNLVDGSRPRHPAAVTARAFDSVAERGSPRRSPWTGAKRLLAVAGTLAVTIALLVAVATHRPAQLAAGPNTVGVIDAGQPGLSAVVTGVGRPNGIAYGAGAAWVTDSADNLLLRIDSAGQVIDRIPVGSGPAGVTVGDGEVWVANELDGTVSEVNPGAGTQVATIGVGIGPDVIAFGYGSVWVANVTSDSLSRIGAATGQVVATIPLGGAPAGVAVGAGAVWVTSPETGELLRVDPGDDRRSQAIAIGQSPDGLAVGGGSVWVADTGGAVSRLDPRTGKVRTIKVGGAPAGVAYSGGAVWVANSTGGSVSRIDPVAGTTRIVHVGNDPTDVAAVGNDVWATVLPSLASHRGGTLTIVALQPAGHSTLPTDPAVAYYTQTWQMLAMTNDGLVGYRRAGGPAGDQLVPDLATALPVPADGGRTYTFHLRAGIRYSTGALVRPEDFRRAIERVFMIDKRQSPFIPPFYAGIAGAARCEHRPGPCNLAGGIVTDDATDTVTFHLTAPDPEFLYKLAFSWAYAVPLGTPDQEISAAQLPATGPYMTKSLVPGRTWILVRNPRFRQWSQQAQPGGYPDRIVLRLDAGPGQAVADVEHGRADVLLSPPPSSIGQLATHYTSQLHSGPLAATIGLALNTRLAPFDKLAARQAVNDAIDRNTVIALNGGPLTAQPTCQILPPTMPGFRPYCPYTIQPGPGGAWTAPNIAAAERLVRVSGTRGDRVTLLDSSQGAGLPSPATGRYVVSVLDQLGYRASLRLTAPDAYFGVLGNSRDRPQIGFFSWYQDYPAPSDFIDPLFACGSFLPGNPGNVNDAEFCDPRIDAQAQQALTLEAANPSAAAGRWAAIDHELVDRAPWVPLYNPRNLNLLSTRVGNYQFHPHFDLLIDQLWAR